MVSSSGGIAYINLADGSAVWEQDVLCSRPAAYGDRFYSYVTYSPKGADTLKDHDTGAEMELANGYYSFWLADGSVALGVKGMPADGDVAALMVDGAFYVKQICIDAVGNLYLFSLNRARADLDLTVWASAGANVSCFGTILMEKRLPLPLR